ncbi:MAG: ATP-binding cassette domain-containing protein, partial [Lachnospiraceae bacterium]|nr:ATP-binding cassette domain-containing protein [Lachnospiraceae bacterium]
MDNQILLSVKNVSKSFPLKGKQRKNVVQDVSFDIYKSETLALVGESGCGKSTLANLIMGILEADSGEIYFDGARISGLPEKARRPYRKRMQMVFQDPASSLDPRMTIRNIIAEPLKAWH